MKKIIIKHISFIFMTCLLIWFIWVLFLCNFFSYSIKKSAYHIVLDSGNILLEICSAGFSKEKFKNFFLSLEHNKEIFDFSIYTKDTVRIADSKKKSLLMSVFKLSYPVKKEGKTAGYIDIWPSHELFLKVITDNMTVFVFIVSLICVLFIYMVLLYVYIKKHVFLPMMSIRDIIDNISGERQYDYFVPNISLWKNIFKKIKKLNSEVIDIKTATKLLFSAANINSAEMEFMNSVHTIFDIIQSKIDKTVECLLFISSESGELKLVAKNMFSNDSVSTIHNGADSVIWTCYCNGEEITVENIVELSDYDSEIFKNENIVKIINIPLYSGQKNKGSSGVLTIGFKNSEYFNQDVLDVLRDISKYFSALIINNEEYSRLKEAKRDVESEMHSVSAELVNTNSVLMQKIRSIKVISDISAYASAKFDLENITGYIIGKITDILDVETAGLYIYSSGKDLFYSVPGSFKITKVIKFENAENTIAYEVFKTKQSVVINSEKEFEKYPNSISLKNYMTLNSMLVSPVKGEDGIVAVVVAVNKVRSAFDDSDKRVLEQIALTISGIIEKIKLYNKIKDGLNENK